VWTGDVDGFDRDDPDHWARAHPGVRTDTNPDGLIPLRFLIDQRQAQPEIFDRLYLNITDRLGTAGSPIDPDTWHRLAVDPLARDVPVVVAVDCGPDQASTTIVACAGDVPTVEVLDHRPGHGWAVDRLADLVDRYDVTTIALDPGAPAGALAADVRRIIGNPLELALRDVTAAAAGIVEAVRTGQVRHVPHPVLDAAVAVARRRPIGDGSWTFDRRRSAGDVSPLIAAMIARWAHPSVAGAAPHVA
jgi:hypothetical protein